jgi:hypothetical protein
MVLADRFGRRDRNVADVTLRDALVIGCAQALALVPGTSRSGVTISAGRLLGFDRRDAARFSFLLSVPVILLATVYEMGGLLVGDEVVDWTQLCVAALVSAVVAYASIDFFMRFVSRIGLLPFAGLEGDSADGLAAALFGDLAVGEETWLSAGVARSSVDLPVRDELETWYADVGLDHFFDPAGIRLGLAYWGDNSVLDSTDARASLYFRGGRGSLSFDYEFRDFELELPEFDFLRRRKVNFDANGIGLGARLDLSESVDVRLKGMSYDYSVNLRLDPNRDIVDLISVTRLSLINTLVDYRASLSLGFDFGLKRLEFETAQWEGAVAGSRTNSYSVRFLTPIGNRNDIEFGLGYDDSENYGEVTVFSVFLYFYGGG